MPADDRTPLLELRRRGGHILARRLPDGMYELEHGGAGDRFQLYTSDAVLVRDVLVSWLEGEEWWSRNVAWSRIDPAVAEMHALRDELTGLLDGLGGFESALDSMDNALARFDAGLGEFEKAPPATALDPPLPDLPDDDMAALLEAAGIDPGELRALLGDGESTGA